MAQRLNERMLRRAEIEIDFSKVRTSKSGKHYVDIKFNEKKKIYRFCTEVSSDPGIFGTSTVWMRCGYNTEISEFKDSHECIFKIKLPPDFKPPEYFAVKSPSLSNDIPALVAQLAIDLNLSINAAASDSMKQFIAKMLKKGFEFARKYPRYDSKALPAIKFSRKTISSIIIEKAKDIQDENEMLLRRFDYYAITLDAGTVTNKHGLFYCAANPALSDEHIFLGTENMESNWCAEDYKKWGEDMLKKYPRLSAFVGDGLRAGIAGLAHFKKDGLCYDIFSTVLFIPCHNHIVNKAFERTIDESPVLGGVITNIANLSVLLKKPSLKGLVVKIPSIPKTRWLYSYDIALWITKKKEEIDKALLALQKNEASVFKDPKYMIFKNGLPQEIFDFVDATKPLKLLQLAYENERVGLPFVYPFYVYAMKKLQILSTSEKKTVKSIALALASHLSAEFKNKSRIPILALAFALTPIGKQYINGVPFLKIFQPVVDLLVNKIDESDITLDFQCDDDEIENKATAQDSAEPVALQANKFVVPIIEKCSDKFARINDAEFDRLFVKDVHLRDDLILYPGELVTMATETLINRYEITAISYKDTSNYQKRLAIKADAEKEGHNLLTFLKSNNPVKFENMFETKKDDLYGYAFWVMKLNEKGDHEIKGPDGTILCKGCNLAVAATNALQLMSIPAGESSCERAISKCRWITGAHNTNETAEMWAARLLTGISASRDESSIFKNPLEE